ncbi:MAG: helix-turn-helix transcriptional regulator [Clostridia bacterium]|nr:helix-turn-helix transcriptional regulator [Clostridia bacterium]
MDFCEKLQQLRKRKGLTQEELAESLYVSRTAVSKWESGRGYPNIDSLKALAAFFGVTIDELLSGDELLTVAEEDSQQKAQQQRDLVFGLLDLSALIFFFMPFFGLKADGAVQAVPLLALGGIATWLKVLYGVVVFGMAAWGVLTLALQGNQQVRWRQYKGKGSLVVNIVGVLLFIISLQPYAAAYLFMLLMIKAFMLIKWP